MFALTVLPALGQIRFTGNGSANWTTTTNWIGGAAPNATDANAQFGPNNVAAGNRTITVNAATITVGTLTFNSSQAYTLSGNTLVLDVSSGSASISMGNTGSLSISSGLTLNDDLVASFTSTSALTVSGTLTANNHNLTFSGAGTGTANISSNFSGTGSVTKSSSGTLTLGGSNGYSGGTTLSAGTLNINNATALGTGNLTISGASTLNNSSGANITLSNNNVQNWNADFTFTGTNSLNVGTGAVTLGGNRSLTITAGNFAVGGAIGDSGNNYSLTKAGAGQLTLSGANTYGGNTTLSTGTLNINNATALGTGTFIISGGTLNNTSGAAVVMTNNNDQQWNADFTFTGANDLDLGAGNVTVGANRQVTVTAGNFTVGGNITDGASNFTLTKAGAGTLILSGANDYNGATTVSAGVLNIRNGSALGNTSSSTTVANNAALEIQGNITVAEDVVISGTGVSSGGVLRNVSGNNTWTGNVNLATNSQISSDSGQLSINGTVGRSGATSRVLTLAGAGDIVVNGSISGNITNLIVNTTGNLTLVGDNAYTGTTALNSGTVNVNSATAFSSGTVTIAGSDLDNTSGAAVTLTNDNTFKWNADFTFIGTNDLNLGAGGVSLNANRTVTVNAGNLTDGGVISGAFSLNKDGAGTMVLSGASTYTGNTTLTGGTLSVSSLANGGSNSNIGKSNANGTSLVFDGGTLQYTGAGSTTNRDFTVTANGGTLDASGTGNLNFNNTTASVLFTGNGTRTLTLTGINTGNNSLGLLIGDKSAGNATSLVKTGAGQWQLTATNTFTGSATVNQGTLKLNGSAGAALNNVASVNLTGGTLLLGAANQINDAATMTLAGGTFNTAGLNETLSTLTLTTSSTIDLGDATTANASVVHFGDSSGQTWTSNGGDFLAVLNWSGSTSGNGSDQVIFGSSNTSLTAGQLSRVVFYNPTGFGSGYFAATLLSTGEIVPTGNAVPVPEPSTYAAGGVLATLAAWWEWRRRKNRTSAAVVDVGEK